MRVMSKKIYPLFAIVLLGSFLVGCVDDFDRNFEFDEYTPSVLIEAKQFIESGNVTVSLLDMGRAYMSESEKSIKANAKADFSIQWGDYRIITEGKEDVVYVPIKVNKKKQQAFSLLTDDGRIKGYSHQIYYAMLLFPGVNGSGFDAVMATYLYGHNMKESDVKRMGRDFESAGYTGYYITSCLDGTMLAGRYVEDGETKIGFRQNPLSPKERKKQAAESDTAKKHNHDHHHLFLNINPQKYVKQTRSGGHDMEWIMTHCPLCEELWDDCQCNIVYPKCSYCGTDVKSNRCAYACSRCDVCLYGNPSHTHTTYTPPPVNPGNGGGGGPGGPSPDPDPEPQPQQPKTFTEMTAQERVEEIKSKMNTVVASIPGKGMQCNNGVGKLFKALFGDGSDVPSYMKGNSDGLHILANQMIRNWQNDTYNWQEISRSNYDSWQEWFNAIQEKANDGYFVVSAFLNEGTNPDGTAKHGHVTVIRPGGTTYSGTWGFGVPTTMDTGSGRRDSSSAISNSYRKSTIKNDSVKFYFYKK